MLVGGLFGMGGYVVVAILNAFLVTDSALALTDTIALTVALSGIVARLMFGRTGLFGELGPDARERGRLRAGGAQVWVAHQQQFWQTAVLGLGSGLLSAWVVVTVYEVDPELVGAVTTLMFGVSAISLILLQFGLDGPVTHHMTLPGALAAAAVITGGGSVALAFILGAVVGVLGGLLGELSSRLFLIHGDTHIDPPAIAIFLLATVVVVFQLALGTV